MLVKHMWPHMNQNPRYVTTSLTFNQLNFCQFVGGKCHTILKTEDNDELFGRLRILSKIAYLFDQCKDWEKARSAYFAILSSIEEGEAYWSSSFGHYDVMCPPKHEDVHSKLEQKTGPKFRQRQKEFFCREFQKGNCHQSPPHKAWIKNSYENVEHFCATCHCAKLGKLQHSPGSDDCVQKK